MHPKMDSGMSKEEKVTLDSLIADHSLPADHTLTPAQVIGFVDQVLNCEVQ